MGWTLLRKLVFLEHLVLLITPSPVIMSLLFYTFWKLKKGLTSVFRKLTVSFSYFQGNELWFIS